MEIYAENGNFWTKISHFPYKNRQKEHKYSQLDKSVSQQERERAREIKKGAEFRKKRDGIITTQRESRKYYFF